MTTSFIIPTLQTQRLILRAPSERDVAPETAFWASERSRFVGGPKPAHEVWRVIAGYLGHWALRGYGFFALDDKATGAYLGRAGFWHPGDWPEREIGWSLMAEAEGKGYATEAALACRAYAYETLGWTTAISSLDDDNDASRAVAERLGCTFERTHDFPGGYTMNIYRHPGSEVLQ